MASSAGGQPPVSLSTPGWIKYYHNWDLDQFLEKYKPSEQTDPGVFWVSVDNKDKPVMEVTDLSYVSSCWNDLVKSGSNITPEDIKAIAAATGYTTGKWLVFRKPSLVDDVWKSIAKATVDGELGTGAKVSSRSSTESSKGHAHVICVYTQDFMDEEDLLRVQHGLRMLGVVGQITYKADIYTTLGIYVNNPWGLKPTLYTSRQ